MREAAQSAVAPTAFLFTDIAGSTVRWEQNREAMQAALHRHDELLRAAIETCGGRVFKTIGDAFCAAFDDAGNAVRAALEAQRRIEREDWQAVNGLRVRMAIALGETHERDGDFFGPTVNRVARLLAAGSGGQILASGAAADTIAPRLPPGVTLRPLGMLAMRGVPDPQRVLQITADGLQSEFAPLRALETPPNNLPNQITRFVGRLPDLRRVEDLLHSHRLVTIVGTGGIGKTRLAVAASSAMLPDTRDGAWFVDLSSLFDAGLVATTILTALGADQTSGRPSLETLVSYLRARDVVLVLDNCEHLVAEVANIVAAILTDCPRTVVLATSREALGVAGEHVHRMSSLTDDEAIELFADRASAVNQSFTVEAENRATVRDLCRRLDGIALAIELAAARMRSISVDDLARRLRLRALAGGPRGKQPRQQTMRALIDWSYDLLADDDRRLFRHISIFAGGFTLEAASGVCAWAYEDEWEMLDALTSLADKSLLVVEPAEPQRYRLLEPLREYARELLESHGEVRDLQARHARTFADIADRLYVQWDRQPRPGWVAATSRDLDNVRTALDWSLNHAGDASAGVRLASGIAPLFLRLSLLRQGIEWCEVALRIASDAATTARLHYGLSMLLHNEGNNVAALDAARRAVEDYRAAGDERGLVRALAQVAHHLEPSSDRALEVAGQALQRARALLDRRLLAGTLQRCAFAYCGARMDLARGAFEESVALFRTLGRDDETARALGAWADAENNAGNHAAAAAIAVEALEIAPEDAKVFISNVLASCYIVLRDTPNALPAARAALASAAQSRHPVALPCAMLYLAALEVDRDAANAAHFAGYARSRLAGAGWALVDPDLTIDARLTTAMRANMTAPELDRHLASGAAWSDEEALAQAVRL